MIFFSNRDKLRRARSTVRGAQEPALRRPRSAHPRVRRQLGRLLMVVCLLAPCAFGSYFLGRHVWASYHWQAAQASLKRHDVAQAQKYLERCLAIRGDSETWFLAARTARRAGNYEQATYGLRECERKEGTTPAILLEQLLLRAQRGDFTIELEDQLWVLIYQHHPDSVLILEAMAQGYIYTYRLGSARVCLERWLQQEPDAIQALLWRAQVCESLGSYDEALHDYSRAVATDPADDNARLKLAVFLAFSGRTDKAVEHFERLWQRQAHNPQVLLGLARCRDSQGRTKEAEQLLDALLRQRPQDVPGLRERAKIALRTGRPDEAESWLRKCLTWDPYDQEATYLLALCLGQRGRETEAQYYRARLERIDADLKRLEAVNRAVGRAPDDASLRHEAALICLRYGQEQEALRWLTGALQVNPQYRPAYQTLANYYEGTGQSVRDAGVAVRDEHR
jgi:tetratricopeptide (TPR) repeat protein